jgi:hypothetical protein
MKSKVLGWVGVPLCAALSLGIGCGRMPEPPPRVAGTAKPIPSAPTGAVVAAAPSSSAHISPPRPPPPIVTTPMSGAPDGRALAESRLVGATCENVQEAARRQAEARIKRMNVEVDEQFQSWREQQPGCWAMYRAMADEARQTARLGSSHGAATYGAVGQAFGYGGLGLSGVGSGGGGRGEGIGLGGVVARKATSASGTNNQVAGVDEADIVKNDGRYVYVAMNGALRILEAMRPSVLSVTKLPGTVREMFVEGDRAVVYVAYGGSGRAPCTYGYDCQFAGDGSSTKIVVLDIADRLAPKIARQIDLSGSLMAARRIGATVHTVVADGDSDVPQYSTWPEGMDSCGVRERTVRARFTKLRRDNAKKILASISLPVIRDGGVEKPLCENLLKTPLADGEAYTTIVSFDLHDDGARAATATLKSRPGAVFASGDALYLSTVHHKGSGGRGWYSFYPSTSEVSDVHKFRIGERPSDTRYVGTGTVPGHVLNQFAMDEYYGYLRIATTRGKVPDPKVASAVSILAEGPDGNLVRVGAVEGLAPGEDIRAVRFDGDRGYVVTFKKTDPLFVLDLYHPARPAVLGELKIPGFSTYMHRIDPDHLLSIGFDANDHGDFAYFDGVILQLFDVSEPTEPKLLHKEKIGTRGSSSEAATNHLAFNYFGERGLLAIPMTVCEGGGDGSFGNQLAFSGLLVYGVSVDKGFSRLGGVDHGTKGADCNTWWSNANSQVKRSIFLDDLVYSIATDRLKVQRMSHFGDDVADIRLD